MENTESGKPKDAKVAQSSETPRQISRRSLLKLGATAVATGGAVLTLEALKVGKKSENDRHPPSFENIVEEINHVYQRVGQEVPEEVLKRLPACNEQGISPEADHVRVVLDSCGVVGAKVRDLYRERKDEYFRKVLGDIEVYTNAKIDKFVAEHKFPDPKNIDSYRNGLKEIYFTP